MLEFIAGFLEHRFRLHLHPQKTRIVRPADTAFLGFTYRLSRYGRVQRQVTHEALGQFRRKIRELARPAPPRSFEAIVRNVAEFVRGWSTYFGFAQDRTVAAARSFARARLRECAWQLWRDPTRRRQELVRLGVAEAVAENAAYTLALPDETVQRPALATAFPNAWFDRFGLGDRLPKPRPVRSSRRANDVSEVAELRAYLIGPEFFEAQTALTAALVGNVPGQRRLCRLGSTSSPNRPPRAHPHKPTAP